MQIVTVEIVTPLNAREEEEEDRDLHLSHSGEICFDGLCFPPSQLCTVNSDCC